MSGQDPGQGTLYLSDRIRDLAKCNPSLCNTNELHNFNGSSCVAKLHKCSRSSHSFEAVFLITLVSVLVEYISQPL